MFGYSHIKAAKLSLLLAATALSSTTFAHGTSDELSDSPAGTSASAKRDSKAALEDALATFITPATKEPYTKRITITLEKLFEGTIKIGNTDIETLYNALVNLHPGENNGKSTLISISNVRHSALKGVSPDIFVRHARALFRNDDISARIKSFEGTTEDDANDSDATPGYYWTEMLRKLSQKAGLDQEVFATQSSLFLAPNLDAHTIESTRSHLEFLSGFSKISPTARVQFASFIQEDSTANDLEELRQLFIESYFDSAGFEGRLQTAFDVSNGPVEDTSMRGILDLITPIMHGNHVHELQQRRVDLENVETGRRHRNTQTSLRVLHSLAPQTSLDNLQTIREVKKYIAENRNKPLNVARNQKILGKDHKPVSEWDNALRALEAPKMHVEYAAISANELYVRMDDTDYRVLDTFTKVWHLIETYEPSEKGPTEMPEAEYTENQRDMLKHSFALALAQMIDEVHLNGKRVCANGKTQRLLSVLQGYVDGIEIDTIEIPNTVEGTLSPSVEDVSHTTHLVAFSYAMNEYLQGAQCNHEHIRSEGEKLADELYPDDSQAMVKREFLDGVQALVDLAQMSLEESND